MCVLCDLCDLCVLSVTCVCPVCPQCDGLKTELQELQVMYDSSQRERTELEEELQHCKAELQKLGGAQVRGRHE